MMGRQIDSATPARRQRSLPRPTVPAQLVPPRRDHKLDQLRELPLLSMCTRGEIAWLGRVTDFVSVRPGYLLQTEGTTPGEVYIVVGGTAVSTCRGLPIGMLGPGELAGDVASLRAEPATCSIEAIQDMDLVSIARRSFTASMAVIPNLSAALLRQWARRPLSHELDTARRSTTPGF